MKPRILIVDDEEEVLLSLSRFFALHDFFVLTAKSPELALKAIEKDKINIAILDINMPGMNGIDLLKRIKKWDFSIQVIMMTGYSTFDKTLQSLEMGAVDYLMKPFDNFDVVLKLVNQSATRLSRWQENLVESIKLQKKKATL